MRYFIDTEFEERGPHEPIKLISIGIVAEDGRELYLENGEYDPHFASDWLKQNVIPHLKTDPKITLRREDIKKHILEFIPARAGDQSWVTYDEPQFWGYFADYDWVVFCQLFGKMIDLPKGYPMFCMDLMQYARHIGVPRKSFPKQDGQEHNALEDARWNRKLYEFLTTMKHV